PRLNDTRWSGTGYWPGGNGVGLSGRVFHQGLDQDAVGFNDKVGVGVAIAGGIVCKGSGHIDAGRGSGKRNLRGIVVLTEAARPPAGRTVKDGELRLAGGIAVGPLVGVAALGGPL